jgi:SAM-dependent methyltransferase
MNEKHLKFCASPEWAAIVRDEVLPFSVGDRDLGDDVLEVGAGPGLTTDILRARVPHLTAVEVDEKLAAKLAERLRGTNVEVVTADGAALPLPDSRFSAATTFSMLHHVPTVAAQDRLLAELCRVLRPGGLLVGSDAVAGLEIDKFHEGDVFVPCDPEGMPERLRVAGFSDIEVDVADVGNQNYAWARNRFRFVGAAAV